MNMQEQRHVTQLQPIAFDVIYFVIEWQKLPLHKYTLHRKPREFGWRRCRNQKQNTNNWNIPNNYYHGCKGNARTKL